MTRRSIGELADVTNAYRSREPFQQIIWRQHAEVEARQQGKRHRESGFLSLIEAASQITEGFSAALFTEMQRLETERSKDQANFDVAHYSYLHRLRVATDQFRTTLNGVGWWRSSTLSKPCKTESAKSRG